MMGVQQPPQSSLFYTGINIEKRVRSNHPLRKANELIDFDFAITKSRISMATTATFRSSAGHLKLMLLLVFYNVRSERELMDTFRAY